MKKYTPLLLSALSLICACAGAPNYQAPNGNWQLSSINGVLINGDIIPDMNFDNGRVNGNSGCNRYGGEVILSNDGFYLDKVFMTKMACLDGQKMELENQMSQLVFDKAIGKIQNGVLVFKNAAGHNVAIFKSVKK